jgi:hypothetical protein
MTNLHDSADVSRGTRATVAPALTALVFGTWMLAFPLGFGGRALNTDGDIARHLRHGETILATRSLIRHDPFSFSRPGEPFVAFEYGSQVLMASAHRLAGLPGLLVLCGLVVAATHALLLRYLLRRGVEPGFAFLATTWAAVLGSMHWAARPHLVTGLLVVVLLDLLDRDEPPVGWLVPLFALWANLHGGWIFGLILIGALAVGHALAGHRRRALRLGIAFPLAAAATLLTPYGLDLTRHVVEFFRQPFLQEQTTEFQPATYRELGSRLFLLTLLGGFAGLAWWRRRPPLPHLLVIVMVGAFAVMARRNIALWSVTAWPLLVIALDPAVRRLPEPPNFRRSFAGGVRGAFWPWAAAAFGLAAVAAGLAQAGRLPLIPTTFDPARFPVAMLREARAARLEGRLLTEFTWGGYTLYAWPEQKVFIDGGTDFYGEPVMREYLDVWTLQANWREVMARRGFDLAILPPRVPLAVQLAREPGWTEWRRDSVSVVLRRSPAP